MIDALNGTCITFIIIASMENCNTHLAASKLPTGMTNLFSRNHTPIVSLSKKINKAIPICKINAEENVSFNLFKSKNGK